MALEQFVTDYGALGLFLGAMAEGEAVAMLGGILSHRNLVPVWAAVMAVAGGAFLIDQVVFWMGRMGRAHPRVTALRQGAAGARVLRTFDRRPDVFAFGFRFLYGFRIAGALTIGTTGYPWPRFALLNAAATLAWAAIFVGLGYVCGQAVEALFGRLHAPRHFLLAGAAALLILFVITHLARRRR